MGYRLREWALNADQPCLKPRTRQVLVAICLVAHDEHGEFWMRGKKLIAEHLPDMSYAAYKNHLSTLARNGLLIKTAHGGGWTSSGRGTSNRYRVDSPVVKNPHPAQTALPDIVKSPEASPPQPEVEEQTPVDASAVHQRIDEMLATGITNEQILIILEATEELLIGSRNKVTVVVIHD